MQREFEWLVHVVMENQQVPWNTGYRDFINLALMLQAMERVRIVRKGNNGFTEGEFHTSRGDCYHVTLESFVEALGLVHSPTTWRNKFTTYFRILDLHSYVEHRGIQGFQLEEHRNVWRIVGWWVLNKDQVLPASDWKTKRYGNTELQRLVKEMLKDASNGEHAKFSQFRCLVEH